MLVSESYKHFVLVVSLPLIEGALRECAAGNQNVVKFLRQF
jgi:hypothetical protein